MTTNKQERFSWRVAPRWVAQASRLFGSASRRVVDAACGNHSRVSTYASSTAGRDARRDRRDACATRAAFGGNRIVVATRLIVLGARSRAGGLRFRERKRLRAGREKRACAHKERGALEPGPGRAGASADAGARDLAPAANRLGSGASRAARQPRVAGGVRGNRPLVRRCTRGAAARESLGGPRGEVPRPRADRAAVRVGHRAELP